MAIGMVLVLMGRTFIGLVGAIIVVDIHGWRRSLSTFCIGRWCFSIIIRAFSISNVWRWGISIVIRVFSMLLASVMLAMMAVWCLVFLIVPLMARMMLSSAFIVVAWGLAFSRVLTVIAAAF